MPYPLDAESEAALAAGRLCTADLVDFYLADSEGAPLTLRAWSWPGEIDYPANDAIDDTDPVTYESMHKRMDVAKSVRLAATLAAEPLQIVLDGSRSADDDDWVGRFVDADWHQRPMRIRQILFNFDTQASATDPVWEWHGRLDHRQLSTQKDQPQTWSVSCEGGLFRVRGRRLHTRSHADQQRRLAGDLFYRGTPNMVGRPLVWAKAQGNVVGAAGGSSGNPPRPFTPWIVFDP